MSWDAETGTKSSNSEKKERTIDEGGNDCSIRLIFGIGKVGPEVEKCP
jgi:hypothetical protein